MRTGPRWNKCEFRKYLSPEVTHYIYSPGFPANFTTAVQCRWVITSPPGFVCRLNCSQIVLPDSPSCSEDRLLISNQGDPSLMVANTYCGRRSVTEVSIGRRITISLLAPPNTAGGRLLCEATAERENILRRSSLAELGIQPWINF
ncbi:embryonic protein UVS.2-like [Ostrinia furnacalis]|uniref:embryonic protein UVS.2-like n=1 Tax=Ostrinia furnacalis TaxID=93504 RepID=UPI00103EEB86|nr:embryonic protein UVS.2-like [Ostrinia furnacalis]